MTGTEWWTLPEEVLEIAVEPKCDAPDAGESPRVAVHVCCGPCASAVIERLADRWKIDAVWHNPNIHPIEEHERRLESMRIVAERTGTPLVVLEYDVEQWWELCAGLEDEPEGGARCEVCFRMRLEMTARWAVAEGVDAITTTLTISPHKDAERIHEIGAEVAARHGLRFLAMDFKKGGGFQRSVELSREWDLYRQKYCGCAPAARWG
ncbi:MAG: epoxyqueuosine reductase QueH [Armatimonadota bacterium]